MPPTFLEGNYADFVKKEPLDESTPIFNTSTSHEEEEEQSVPMLLSSDVPQNFHRWIQQLSNHLQSISLDLHTFLFETKNKQAEPVHVDFKNDNEFDEAHKKWSTEYLETATKELQVYNILISAIHDYPEALEIKKQVPMGECKKLFDLICEKFKPRSSLLDVVQMFKKINNTKKSVNIENIESYLTDIDNAAILLATEKSILTILDAYKISVLLNDTTDISEFITGCCAMKPDITYQQLKEALIQHHNNKIQFNNKNNNKNHHMNIEMKQNYSSIHSNQSYNNQNNSLINLPYEEIRKPSPTSSNHNQILIDLQTLTKKEYKDVIHKLEAHKAMSRVVSKKTTMQPLSKKMKKKEKKKRDLEISSTHQKNAKVLKHKPPVTSKVPPAAKGKKSKTPPCPVVPKTSSHSAPPPTKSSSEGSSPALGICTFCKTVGHTVSECVKASSESRLPAEKTKKNHDVSIPVTQPIQHISYPPPPSLSSPHDQSYVKRNATTYVCGFCGGEGHETKYCWSRSMHGVYKDARFPLKSGEGKHTHFSDTTRGKSRDECVDTHEITEVDSFGRRIIDRNEDETNKRVRSSKETTGTTSKDVVRAVKETRWDVGAAGRSDILPNQEKTTSAFQPSRSDMDSDFSCQTDKETSI